MEKETISPDNLDIKFIVGSVWAGRKKLTMFLLVFFAMGVCVVLMSEDEYVAKSLFVPKSAEAQKSGKIRGLASLAGINLNSGGTQSDLSPLLYSKIVNSVPFRLELSQNTVRVKGIDGPMSYASFYENYYKPSALSILKKYTIGLPKQLSKMLGGKKEVSMSLPDNSGFKRLSSTDKSHIGRLKGQVSIRYNELEGYVELSVSMPDPLMSAQMTKFAEEILQRMVIDHRLSDAREELKFTQELLEAKELLYEKAMASLAIFRDKNQSITSARATSELQKLQADFDLAFSVYSDIASQFEQVKLQVSKDIPIFTIIEPVSVPGATSGPRKSLIVLIFGFFGILAGLGFIFGKLFLQKLKVQNLSDWAAS